jgi:hypothetical protein
MLEPYFGTPTNTSTHHRHSQLQAKSELCVCISDLYNETNFGKKVSFDFESLIARQAKQS